MRKALCALVFAGVASVAITAAPSEAPAAGAFIATNGFNPPTAVTTIYYRGRHYYRGPAGYGRYAPRAHYGAPRYYAPRASYGYYAPRAYYGGPAYYAPPVVYYPPPVVVYYPPPVVYGGYPQATPYRYYGAPAAARYYDDDAEW